MNYSVDNNPFAVPADADRFQTLIEDSFDDGRVLSVDAFAEKRSPEEISRFLHGGSPSGIAFEENDENIIDLLRRIDDDPACPVKLPRQLRGLSGFVSMQVLRRLLLGTVCETRGKIRNFIYLPDKESGHISIDVWTDCTGQGLDQSDRVEFLHWDIEVSHDFITHVRDEDNTEDPFPTVDLELPDKAKERDNPKGIWKRGLNRKIHARGCTITIRNVFQRIGSGKLVLLDKSHQYYQVDNDSCIDFMVGVKLPDRPVPTTFGDLPTKPVSGEAPSQLGYCLGRCAHPAIVNTDAP